MMNDEKPKNEQQRVAKFDLVIVAVVIVLVAIIGVVSYVDSPQRNGAMVAYLYPLTSSETGTTVSPNIWLAPVFNAQEARQLTTSRIGVFDFGVSNNGRFIAYSERDESQLLLDIYLIDLQNNKTTRLTNCAASDSECYSPVFHPDNNTLAYMRKSLNTDVDAIEASASHIWLYDIAKSSTQPLTQDSQLVGHSPIWSPDGNTIAFFSADFSNSQILIYNFNPQLNDKKTINAVPSQNGTTGSISPNGQRLIFPDIIDRGGVVDTYLKIVDLSTDPPQFADFTDKQGLFSDLSAQWHPDGQTVTVARKYNDERWTAGYQLYDIDVNTGVLIPVIVDPRYTHSYYLWNATGTRLLIQRLGLQDENGNTKRSSSPAVWVLDNDSGRLIKISDSAYHPRWVLP